MMAKAQVNPYLVPLEELLEAGCHFGHQARRWHPRMASYIWGERNGIHIIDLAKTQSQLAKACGELEKLAREGKKVVFIGTKRQASGIVEEEAQKSGLLFVSKRWLGGTFTNWKQIKKSIDRLNELETKRSAGELEKYTKREQLLIDREIEKLQRFLGGLRGMTDMPSAVFVVDVKREITAVSEAKKLGVAVIAIVDTNCNPGPVNLVIPANDDAIWSIRLIVTKLAEAYRKGKIAYDAKQSSESRESANEINPLTH